MLEEKYKKLGRNIKYYRTQKGMTCLKLANILHRQERIIEEIEEGKRSCQLKTLEKISRALDVPIDKFLNFENVN